MSRPGTDDSYVRRKTLGGLIYTSTERGGGRLGNRCADILYRGTRPSTTDSAHRFDPRVDDEPERWHADALREQTREVIGSLTSSPRAGYRRGAWSARTPEARH